MKRRPPWFYQQSGVIPYRDVQGAIEVLLVTSRRRARWIIPKGLIDLGSTAEDSACKEAYEEAGIIGEMSPRPIGEYQYRKWGGICTVKVFVLKVHTVLEAWPEALQRRRRWMTAAAAAQAVEEPQLRDLILRVPNIKI